MVDGHEGSSHVSPTIFDVGRDGGLSKVFDENASIHTFENHNRKGCYIMARDATS